MTSATLTQFMNTQPSAIIRRAGETLYHQGDALRYAYRVQSGLVMAYRLHSDGTRQITGFFREGDVVGLARNGMYDDTAVMLGDGRLTALSAARIEREPELQAELYHQACEQLSDAHARLVQLAKQSSDAKVAGLLLRLARHRIADDGTVEVVLPTCRQDIADYLGIAPETVSRRLAAMKREGLVELPNRHSARILDLEGLRARAAA